MLKIRMRGNLSEIRHRSDRLKASLDYRTGNTYLSGGVLILGLPCYYPRLYAGFQPRFAVTALRGFFLNVDSHKLLYVRQAG